MIRVKSGNLSKNVCESASVRVQEDYCRVNQSEYPKWIVKRSFLSDINCLQEGHCHEANLISWQWRNKYKCAVVITCDFVKQTLIFRQNVFSPNSLPFQRYRMNPLKIVSVKEINKWEFKTIYVVCSLINFIFLMIDNAVNFFRFSL